LNTTRTYYRLQMVNKGARAGFAEHSSAFFQTQAWDEDTEMVLMDWAEQARARSGDHETMALHAKQAHNSGLGFVLLAIVMAPLSGLILFFDVSGLAQKHLSFSSRYADFYSEVLDTLSKPVRCRPVSSTFQAEKKQQFEGLNRYAPDLSGLGNSRCMVMLGYFSAGVKM